MRPLPLVFMGFCLTAALSYACLARERGAAIGVLLLIALILLASLEPA